LKNRIRRMREEKVQNDKNDEERGVGVLERDENNERYG
jgi:hypothetical protein